MTLGAGAGVNQGGGNGGGNSGGGSGDANLSAGGSASGAGDSSGGAGAATGGQASGQSTSVGGAAASGGGVPPSWLANLPDDIKADPTLNKYSDVANLAKAHIALQAKIGQKGIFKPGKDATPEQLKAFREELGIPTDPSKYELGAFDGVKIDPAVVQWAQKMGAEHGIEPAAMKTVITEYYKLDAQNQQRAEVARLENVKTGYTELRKEWGDAFDQKIQRAQAAAAHLEEKAGIKGLVERLTKFGAQDDPLLLKAFEHMASLLGEDRMREAGIGSDRQTPMELDSELSQVRAQLISIPKNDARRLGLLNQLEGLERRKAAGVRR